MNQLSPDELRALIEKAGTSATALALDIGRDKGYISDYLAGRKRSLKPDDWSKILRLLRVDQNVSDTTSVIDLHQDSGSLAVIGNIQAGAWMEAFALEGEHEPERVPIARDVRFRSAKQYVLRVVGDSMDLEAPEGSLVHCVEFVGSGLTRRAGMIVHVERIMNGLAETTLKEIGYENGALVLLPRSSNPIHKPIYPTKDQSAQPEIRGAVLGVYRPTKL